MDDGMITANGIFIVGVIGIIACILLGLFGVALGILGFNVSPSVLSYFLVPIPFLMFVAITGFVADMSND